MPNHGSQAEVKNRIICFRFYNMRIIVIRIELNYRNYGPISCDISMNYRQTSRKSTLNHDFRFDFFLLVEKFYQYVRSCNRRLWNPKRIGIIKIEFVHISSQVCGMFHCKLLFVLMGSAREYKRICL